MAWDPFAPKQLAAVIAVGGLSFMMLEPAPNWGSVGIGIASIVGFLGLSLFPSARQAEPAEPEFDSPAPEWPPARRTLDLLDNRPPPPPSRLLASQPVVFKVMRERRRARRG